MLSRETCAELTSSSDLQMLESKKPANPAEVNAVVNYLTGKNSDQALIVRVFCIRGVGSLALFGSKMVRAV